MRKICIDDLKVGDKFKIYSETTYVREVKQILTGQNFCEKQLLCFTVNGDNTYHSVHDCTGIDVYLVEHKLKFNELEVGDHFRWYDGDKILKTVTEKLDDHIVYTYTAFGTACYSVYCAAELTWNDEVILEDEETN